MSPAEIKALQFFTAKEIAKVCRDAAKVDRRVFDALEKVRAAVGLPFTLTSLTGGAHVEGSLHYLGLAVDWQIETKNADPRDIPTANRVIEIMLDSGFHGIGYYPEYNPRLVFHGDVRGRTQLWTRAGGKYCDLVK